MSLLNYMKLDLRIWKKYLLISFSIIFLTIIINFKYRIFLFNINAYTLYIANIPFLNYKTQNFSKLYFIFPKKIKTAILGRFSYLFFVFSLITAVNIISLKIFNINNNPYIIFFIEGMCFIICLINYLMQYLFSVYSIIKDLIPALSFFIFLLLSLLTVNNKFLFTQISSNKFLFSIIFIILIIVSSILSIYISINAYSKRNIHV